MVKLLNLTSRSVLILVHDLLATAAAIIVTFYVRFEGAGLAEREDLLVAVLPGFLVYAAVVYWFFELNKGKWRFASLPDLSNIVRASTVLALSLLVLDYILVAPTFLGTFFFGKITIALYWFLQICFLGGSRVAYRYFRYLRTRQHARVSQSAPTLVLGRAADAEVLLRAIESGAVSKIWPVGILSPSRADQGQAIRGVAVLGGFDDLERVVTYLQDRNTRVVRLVLSPAALAPELNPEAILMRA
ncbi:MAG TPA: capsular biosynthesis protein, partial [Xanthobacteraceae bacterium]|nr:capsular biosynthesis protein [Xanthobacteraceae bacterium]